jgi:hypothetical protein
MQQFVPFNAPFFRECKVVDLNSKNIIILGIEKDYKLENTWNLLDHLNEKLMTESRNEYVR